MARFGDANVRVWSPGRSRSHFSQTTTTTRTTTTTTLKAWVTVYIDPTACLRWLSARTAICQNHDCITYPLRCRRRCVSLSFGTFGCESVVRVTRFFYRRRDLNPFRCVRPSVPPRDRHDETFARERGWKIARIKTEKERSGTTLRPFVRSRISWNIVFCICWMQALSNSLL